MTTKPPAGGEVGRRELPVPGLGLVDELGTHAHLAEAVGVDADRVRHWWARNNYRVKELAVRSDLRPPLFHIPTASRILRNRIDAEA